MNDETAKGPGNADVFGDIRRAQTEFVSGLFGQLGNAAATPPDAAQWADAVSRMQKMWSDFQAGQVDATGAQSHYTDPAKWLTTATNWYQAMPFGDAGVQKQLWEDGLSLATGVLGSFGIGPQAGNENTGFPRSDPRFADPSWREQPLPALVHQTYLMLSDQLQALAESAEGLEPARQQQLKFATRAMLDAISPSNFALTNPVALNKAIESKGESLVKGMENLVADLKRGQLTHTSPDAFKLGENIAVTPGKVVHQTDLYQLIQYSPTTETVLATPLVIFPPWINRFYILDLNAKKSFVRWAVEQGVTVFMVSWKSADASMADVVWDDYIAAQIDAIDTVRARLKVPSVHAIGYCVAGTTLAATLAVLARKGEGDRVKSATFFTAQVDFEEAGDLKHFIDDGQLETIGQLGSSGFVDGRYLAATFNLLRGNDLIWNYVVKNYLLGEDYPAFDLLHWNGDATNLPVKWHRDYLRDMYRDNRLVVPDSLRALDTPIDLRKIKTPVYIQAGREDHIAPPHSVWKLMRHLGGPKTFLLAGSGHIAGVVNPPAAGKYQYWVNDHDAETLEEYVAGAVEHPGSWWPHWIAWLRDQEGKDVPAKGKRKPGGRGDRVIEDAPGTYVRTR